MGRTGLDVSSVQVEEADHKGSFAGDSSIMEGMICNNLPKFCS